MPGARGLATLFVTPLFSFLLCAAKADSGHVPLHFEPNAGQFDSQVRYVSRGNGYTLFLTDTGVVMALDGGAAGDAIVRMKFAGGRPAQRWEALEQQPGITNYFFGNDPSKWR